MRSACGTASAALHEEMREVEREYNQAVYGRRTTYDEEQALAAGGAPIWENDVPPLPPFGGGSRQYWQNPDGTPKALCAAPAGPGVPESAPREAAVAPVRPVLNPEEEDESDVESGLGEDEVPPPCLRMGLGAAAPPPERIWVHGAWTEWEETPEAEGRSHFPSVKRWRFKHTVKSGSLDRPVIQVEFRGETHTHVLCTEQVKMVTNKIRGAEGGHEVVIDTTKQKGQWNPTYLKFRFQKAENALAFQMSLVDFLSC